MIVGITGATGFIGSKLLCRLSDDPERKVIGLARKIPPWLPKTENSIEWRQGNLLSAADCAAMIAGVDTIIHLASATVPLSTRSVVDETNLSLLPTLNLIQAARETGKPIHFIFASSGGQVYGMSEQHKPWEETDRCEPVSLYGTGKLAAEHHLQVMARDGSIRSTILRVANVYGKPLAPERRQGFIGVALHQLIQNLPIPLLGDIHNVRDYVHLDDVCVAFERACSETVSFSRYNIGTGVGSSTLDVLDHLKSAWGTSISVDQIDVGSSAPALISWNVLSVDKAKAWGWIPRINLRDGINKMIHDAKQ